MIFNYILRLSGVRSFSTVGGPCAENNIAPYLIKRLNEVADKNEINNLKKDCEEIDYSKSDNIDDDFKHFLSLESRFDVLFKKLFDGCKEEEEMGLPLDGYGGIIDINKFENEKIFLVNSIKKEIED